MYGGGKGNAQLLYPSTYNTILQYLDVCYAGCRCDAVLVHCVVSFIVTMSTVATTAPINTIQLKQYNSQLITQVYTALRHRAKYHNSFHYYRSLLSVLFSFIVLYYTYTIPHSTISYILYTIVLCIISLILFILSIYGIIQYYKPLPILSQLTPQQCKLFGINTNTTNDVSPIVPAAVNSKQSIVPANNTIINSNTLRQRATNTPAAQPYTTPIRSTYNTMNLSPNNDRMLISPIRQSISNYNSPINYDRINNTNELNTFINETNKSLRTSTQVIDSYRSPYSSMQYTMSSTPVYSPSIRSHHSTPVHTHGKFALADPASDIQCGTEAHQLYIKLGIDQSIDIFINRLKIWLSQHIFKPLIAEIHEVDKQLHQLSQHTIQHMSNQLTPNEINLLRNYTEYNTIEYATLLCNKHPNLIVTDQLQNIFKFYNINSTLNGTVDTSNTVKQYVKQRIIELGSIDRLGTYKYDNVNTSLPSDSAIILHCFLTHLTNITQYDLIKYCYKPYNVSHHSPIRTKYCVIVSTRPNTVQSYYIIQYNNQTSTMKSSMQSPHTPQPQQQLIDWLSTPGRNNIYETIILYIYYINKYCSNRIGTVMLNSNAIDQLDSVIRNA